MPQNVWIDGRIEPSDAPLLRVTDRGFQLGDGIFETLRARRGVPIELDEHLERLRESAVPLGIALPADDEPLIRAIAKILRAEGLAGDGTDGRTPGDAALRITASRGALPGRGLAPAVAAAGAPVRATIVIQAWPHVPPSADAVERGLWVVTSSVRRVPGSPLAGVKTTSRAESVYARLEAERAGADDAIVLTTHGEVGEATSANVFIVRGGRLLTPPLDSGCLAGTTREWLLANAAVHDLAAEEASLRPADLVQADEILLSSSVAGLVAVTRLDGQPVGRGTAGPTTLLLRRMREEWIDRVSLARA
jgi:branched-chain amino acid aminotransferase